CVTIGVGYRLWWIRRPPQAAWDPAHSLLQAWLSLAWPARILVLGLAFALGLAMPLMGASLLLFIAVDYLRWRAATAMRMMKSSD
ncbi:PepSY domain-containing protein, partial [Klebsiella pneumoniae]|nr:PepSY domain-containing protein [Klebsiella pneumoniae]